MKTVVMRLRMAMGGTISDILNVQTKWASIEETTTRDNDVDMLDSKDAQKVLDI